jgi:hypothetical protein
MVDFSSAAMQKTYKYGVRFAAVGFTVGMALCAYTFFLTSHHRIGSLALFLVLCPPSLGAMVLDNAGVIGGVIGWFLIALVNAGLYGLLGLGVDSAFPIVVRRECTKFEYWASTCPIIRAGSDGRCNTPLVI